MRGWSRDALVAGIRQCGIEPGKCKKWVAGKHSCDGGTQILHKKDALEFTSVALEPDWCVRIHQSGAGAAMLHKSGALESTRAALEP